MRRTLITGMIGCLLLTGIVPVSASVDDAPTAEAAEPIPPPGCVRLQRQSRIAWHQGEHAAAVTYLEEAEPVCPDSAGVILARLELHRLMEDAAGASADLHALRALLAEKDTPLPAAVFARSILDPAATPEELEMIRTRLAADSSAGGDDPGMLRALAVVEARLGNIDAARLVLEQLLTEQDSPEIRWAAARVSLAAGKNGEALDDLETLAGENTIYAPWAERELFGLYGELGNADKVLHLADSILEASSARAQLVVNGLLDAAWALYDRADLASARRLFERAADIDPSNQEAVDAVRLLFGSAEDRAAQRHEADERLADEEDPELLLEEGTQRLAAGDAVGALPLLKRASASLPDEPIAWYNLGMAALQSEEWSTAADALARSVALEPGQPNTVLNLGIALAKAERCAEAVDVLEALAASASELYQAQYYLYTCHRDLGNDDRARTALETYNAARSQP